MKRDQDLPLRNPPPSTRPRQLWLARNPPTSSGHRHAGAQYREEIPLALLLPHFLPSPFGGLACYSRHMWSNLKRLGGVTISVTCRYLRRDRISSIVAILHPLTPVKLSICLRILRVPLDPPSWSSLYSGLITPGINCFS